MASTHLQLPYLEASQSQKHVTVNEAVRKLDAIVQLSVISATTDVQPGDPADGDRYILPSGKTGDDWGSMTDYAVAYYVDGAWQQITPREGWLAYVADADGHYAFDGTDWDAFDGGNIAGFKFSETVYFTATGSFVKASYPGIRAVEVEMIGGGGAGGGAQATTSGQQSTGGGGGSGQYARKFILASALSASETVTVGAGGVGASGATGGNGGASSFGAHVSAGGGSGSARAAASTSVGTSPVGAGGTGGAGGDLMIGGNSGAFGFQFLNPNASIGGPGAPSYFGGAAPSVAGVNGSNAGVAAAANTGGGGGGAASEDSGSAVAGGNGGSGIVIVRVYK